MINYSVKWISNVPKIYENVSKVLNTQSIRPIYSYKDASIRSGPYIISEFGGNSYGGKIQNHYTVGQRSEPSEGLINLPFQKTKLNESSIPVLDSFEYGNPKVFSANNIWSTGPKQYEINRIAAMAGRNKGTENLETILVNMPNGFCPSGNLSYSDRDKIKYKIDSRYSELRDQILGYIKSKYGIRKREHDIRFEKGSKENGSLDVSFQKILEGAEDFLNSMIVNLIEKNSTQLDVKQPQSSLVEENNFLRKIPVLQRSLSTFNDTLGEEKEEEDQSGPETKEIVDSLNHLTLNENIFHTLDPLSIGDSDEDKEESEPELKRNHKPRHDNLFYESGKNRLLELTKDSDNVINENMEKVTEIDFEPIEVIDEEEVNDLETTEAADVIAEFSNLELVDKVKNNLQGFKPVDKTAGGCPINEDALNRKIDLRICNALDLLKSVLQCQADTGSTDNYSNTSPYSSSIVTDEPDEVVLNDTTARSCVPNVHQTVMTTQATEDDETISTDSISPSSSTCKRKNKGKGQHAMVTRTPWRRQRSTSHSIRKVVKESQSDGDEASVDPVASQATVRSKKNLCTERVHTMPKRVKATGVPRPEAASPEEKIFFINKSGSYKGKNIKHLFPSTKIQKSSRKF